MIQLLAMAAIDLMHWVQYSAVGLLLVGAVVQLVVTLLSYGDWIFVRQEKPNTPGAITSFWGLIGNLIGLTVSCGFFGVRSWVAFGWPDPWNPALTHYRIYGAVLMTLFECMLPLRSVVDLRSRRRAIRMLGLDRDVANHTEPTCLNCGCQNVGNFCPRCGIAATPCSG